MQLDFFADGKRSRPPHPSGFQIGPAVLPVQLVRNFRAKRYVLRLTRQGVVRVTIPRAGSITFGVRFIERNREWLERQWHKRQLESASGLPWKIGAEILFRGVPFLLTCRSEGDLQIIEFADQTLYLTDQTQNLRVGVESHLWKLAKRELPPRTAQLASTHGVTFRKVVVRNQRSRWGSCSHRGTISLNWRLIQTPPEVQDYLILHELMHRKEMNHSPRFWQWVAAVCPEYRAAEDWLNSHASLLR